jgi:hypothetical protein
LYTSGNSELSIEVYADADLGRDISTGRSTSGCVVLLGGCPVHWRSSKQTLVASSTVESELISAALGSREGLWISRLVAELLGKVENIPILLRVDNQGAIALSSKRMVSKFTKHIALKWFFTRQCVEEGLIDIVYVPGTENTADIFTKPLGKVLFKKFRNSLSMHYS